MGVKSAEMSVEGADGGGAVPKNLLAHATETVLLEGKAAVVAEVGPVNPRAVLDEATANRLMSWAAGKATPRAVSNWEWLMSIRIEPPKVGMTFS
jgi:hypothetical protein